MANYNKTLVQVNLEGDQGKYGAQDHWCTKTPRLPHSVGP